MANGIKIGTNNISGIKIGTADVDAVYIGTNLVYSSTPPTPTFQGKWLATYSDSSTSSADCDASSAITSGEVITTDLVAVEIGDCVSTIDVNAFSGYTTLTSIDIPDSVTTIGQSAFKGCSSLTSIDIPDSVTSIGTSAFTFCSGLTSIDIPDSVTSIGNYAFKGCSGLTSVTIGSGVTTIGQSVFSQCYSLSSIDIPNSVTSIGNNVFYQCSGLTSCTIGSGVTSISQSAFSGCSSLTNIDIPDSVTSIGQSAFTSCSGLSSIDIPSGVTSIGNGAFRNCSSLTSIDIPSGVTSIGNYAFYNCSSLSSVTINATTPPTLGSSAFRYTNECQIYVPAASVDAYKAASGWRDYESRIQSIKSWHQIATGESISENAYAIRVSTGVTGLNSGQNATFGTLTNTYSILWENGNWYEWRVMTDGQFTPDSKTLLTAEDGYYTITIDITSIGYIGEPFMGCDADAYGQGGVMYATFPFEIYY